jgi:hypothetical protein
MWNFREKFTERALNDGIEEAIVYGALIKGSVFRKWSKDIVLKTNGYEL